MSLEIESMEQLREQHRSRLVRSAFRSVKGKEPGEKEYAQWIAFLCDGGDPKSMLQQIKGSREKNDVVQEGELEDSNVLRVEPTDGPYKGTVHLCSPLGRLAAGAPVKLQIRIENKSDFSWESQGDRPICPCYHWRKANGEVALFDGVRTPLPGRLDPDESMTLDLQVVTPGKAGKYILELTLVHEGICWLEHKGFSALRCSVSLERCLSARVTKVWSDFSGKHAMYLNMASPL